MTPAATVEASEELGAELEIADGGGLAEAGALAKLQTLLDRHGVVRIAAGTPVPPAAIAALANHLGTPRALDGVRVKFVPGFDIISDLSAKAKIDDGRPRRRALQEDLHYDFAAGQHAAYSILHTREIPQNDPMVFVDMRRVYADLRPALKAQIGGLRHASCGPLVARHPRTGETILSLPPRQETQIDGLSEDDATALIRTLWGVVDRSPHRREMAMRDNDVFVWDGLCAVHSNPVFPRGEDRTIWFLTLPLDAAATLQAAA